MKQLSPAPFCYTMRMKVIIMYTLLVVDDEKIIRQGIARLINLRQIGIDTIYEADNGKMALALMAKHPIDIILADINMPIMNGLEFSKIVKQNYPACRIALITGYDYLDYAIQAVKIGVDDYILKPASKDDIQALLMHMAENLQKNKKAHELERTVEKLQGAFSHQGSKSIKDQLMDVIRENLENQDFSLQQLAFDMGYNISYLSSIFKQYFGMSFRDYLLEQRLEKARLLMLTTQMKNYEVAEVVGIKDANYFSTCFKRKYHVTVTEFRNGRLL